MSVLPPAQTAVIPSLTVEGYRFYRSDGEPFDGSIQTFVPQRSSLSSPPYAAIIDNEDQRVECVENEFYHVCDATAAADNASKAGIVSTPAAKRPFMLAHRCEPSWNDLSEQQRNVIVKIEEEINEFRLKGVYFRSIILEGIGGCGKTRLMAYVINHAPDNTHVLYLTKQNKRLQDFLYDELAAGEVVPPRPVTDMSKFIGDDFRTLHANAGGRYACSVEKLVYHTGGYRMGHTYTSARNVVQWKLNIPDRLFADSDVKNNKSNVVVFLDEYTMIPPPLLHKMIHCIQIMFSAPTVLIMGGDRFQLGPINWSENTDCRYADAYGEEAPPDAVTKNNRYYLSDVRSELEQRMGQKPFEYNMKGSQRSREDPDLAIIVAYLRRACEMRSSSKAIERHLVTFGRRKGINMFRYEVTRNGCKSGLLNFCNINNEESEDISDDDDRHLGDDDSRDEMEEEKEGGKIKNGVSITIDWNTPPTVDMTPFIEFYVGLYKNAYRAYINAQLANRPVLHPMSEFVYKSASQFARNSFPVFMVKKNNKCNLLSDTFLKTLYNGVYKRLMDESNIKNATDTKEFLEGICVSMSVSNNGPVQQTVMVGVPYRMTDTLRFDGSPVVSNGELVLLTGIGFEGVGCQRRVSYVTVKTLQRQCGKRTLIIVPGVTKNRLTGNGTSSLEGSETYMLPMVPMICENIYQLQGNTIVSNCYVDLLSTKSDDMYVAISRFRNTSSIRGIILSR